MNKYGDILFGNKKYGYKETPSLGDFVIAYIFSKVDISNSTCHCLGCYPCDDDISKKINNFKNI